MSTLGWSCTEQRRHLGEYLTGQMTTADLVLAGTHLETCHECGEELALWTRWKHALKQPSPLSPQHAQQLSARVMRALGDQVVFAPPHRRNGIMRATMAAAAVILVGIVTWQLLPKKIQARLPQHAERQEESPLVLGASAQVSLDEHVRLSTSDGAVARWRQEDNGDKFVSLERGSLSAEVSPLPGHSEFRVCTVRTCVRVIGTAFTLTAATNGDRDQVEVAHGLVAVSQADMPGIEIVLSAGDKIFAPWQGASAFALPADAPRSNKVSAPLTTLQRRPSERPECARPTRDAILSDPISAEGCLASAGVETWTLLADAYLKAKLPLRAYAVYLKIYREFPESREAESALFLLAKLEDDRGDSDAANRRFAEYLARYEHGEFAEEVMWRQAMLQVHARRFQLSIQLLERLVSSHPDGARIGDALFLLGSIYDRELENTERARTYYQRYLQLPEADEQVRETTRQRLSDLPDGK